MNYVKVTGHPGIKSLIYRYLDLYLHQGCLSDAPNSKTLIPLLLEILFYYRSASIIAHSKKKKKKKQVGKTTIFKKYKLHRNNRLISSTDIQLLWRKANFTTMNMWGKLLQWRKANFTTITDKISSRAIHNNFYSLKCI